jgi:hypothetical protein
MSFTNTDFGGGMYFAQTHFSRIAPYLPALEPSIKVELLIGRDIPEIHHVHEQILGDKGKPFAQKLPLGWVIIGEVCLGKVHAPTEISVRKTHVLNNGRSTTFPLCEYNIKISELKDDIFVRTSNFERKVFLYLQEFVHVHDEFQVYHDRSKVQP